MKALMVYDSQAYGWRCFTVYIEAMQAVIHPAGFLKQRLTKKGQEIYPEVCEVEIKKYEYYIDEDGNGKYSVELTDYDDLPTMPSFEEELQMRIKRLKGWSI